MLNSKEMQEVRDRYIELLSSVTRKNCDVQGFIDYLDSTDFFTAPASTQYHCSFPGGLCLHSLNVCEALSDLVRNKYTNDTVILVSLLHDLDKIGKYEMYTKNEKVYIEPTDEDYQSPDVKRDAEGFYVWRTKKMYKVADADRRGFLGNKGIISYLKASEYFALTDEETNALVYQYSAVEKEPLCDLSAILSRYNLAVYLHSADIIATYCIEK